MGSKFSLLNDPLLSETNAFEKPLFGSLSVERIILELGLLVTSLACLIHSNDLCIALVKLAGASSNAALILVFCRWIINGPFVRADGGKVITSKLRVFSSSDARPPTA